MFDTSFLDDALYIQLCGLQTFSFMEFQKIMENFNILKSKNQYSIANLHVPTTQLQGQHLKANPRHHNISSVNFLV